MYDILQFPVMNISQGKVWSREELARENFTGRSHPQQAVESIVPDIQEIAGMSRQASFIGNRRSALLRGFPAELLQFFDNSFSLFRIPVIINMAAVILIPSRR